METTENERDIIDTLVMLKGINLSSIIDGITPNGYIFLKIIQTLIERSKSDATYVSEIGNKLEISAPAVSRMLKSLEAKGLIRREIDSENRRNTFVFLTDKGYTVKANADKSLNLFFKNVYKKVGRENIDQFRMLAKKITTVVFEELKYVEERNGVYCEKKLC
jgi:DNA-binding MarR family transcriptional regulator